MQSCPNIGGREVRRRLHIGYFSLFLTIATVLYIFIYNDGQRRLLVFFPSLVMGIVLFEAIDKTCIVNAYFGIKNMGEKKQRERNFDFLKVQRFKSLIIIVKGIITAIAITAIIYYISPTL